jgi:hypothetical protein
MAVYKEKNYLGQNDNSAFDNDYSPGDQAQLAGIYRCMSCHREIGFAGGTTLPRQDHHTHSPLQGVIRWRLIVWADHNPK